ncbi:MAG TPA: CocE/NonD family hydrolase, partial [Verrucomicrobiae bacterium]|nr:CocE/NonD family hydrolase [Verrucomicrobiae bacterium]
LSYMADTADHATGSRAGLTGAIVRQADFDVYRHLMVPGGIWNDAMLEAWGADTLRRDLGRSVDPALGLDCALRVADCPALFPRLTPVDEDHDFALVRAAFAGRQRWTSETYADADFIDDEARNGSALAEFSASARLADIRRQGTPVQYWGSWMDAGTADSALARYRAAPNVPTQVIITANSHGGDQNTDPFLSGEQPPAPAFESQVETMMDFAARVRAGERIERSIHYYVLGAGEFRDTRVWPPRGVSMRRFHFAEGQALNTRRPRTAGADAYDVEFTASTGGATRWSTQLGTAAAYGDRRAADERLISYTSAPFDRDMELAGRPAVTITLSAQTADPAIFVYLEDVAPDGRVTYLTEGQLRAVSRRLAGRDELTYPIDGPAHTHERADAIPIVPGEAFEVRIGLFPVAALIRQGHAIRVSIAGADADTFRRHSEGGPDRFTIMYGGANVSALSLPLRPWS